MLLLRTSRGALDVIHETPSLEEGSFLWRVDARVRPAAATGTWARRLLQPCSGMLGTVRTRHLPQLSRPTVASSAAQVNWDRRVAALARCAGLVAGGAAGFNALPDLLRRLMRDALSLQIADRWIAFSVIKSIPWTLWEAHPDALFASAGSCARVAM